MGVSYTFELNEAALSSETLRIGRQKMASLKRRTATQARVDVPVDTGNLGRSIGEGPTTIEGPFTVGGSVHATAHYAAPVHEGARPHIIRPKNAKALRFEVDGRVVFARLVRHPGNRARPFLRNAGMRVAAEMAASD